MKIDNEQEPDWRLVSLETELHRLKAQRGQQQAHQPKPLDGIRALDMSQFIFGPFCKVVELYD